MELSGGDIRKHTGKALDFGKIAVRYAFLSQSRPLTPAKRIISLSNDLDLIRQEKRNIRLCSAQLCANK